MLLNFHRAREAYMLVAAHFSMTLLDVSTHSAVSISLVIKNCLCCLCLVPFFLAGCVLADRVWPLPCVLGWHGAARTLLPCHREAFGLVWWFTA